MRINAALTTPSQFQTAYQNSANQKLAKAGGNVSSTTALAAPVQVSVSLMKRSQMLQKAMVNIQLQMLGHKTPEI